MQLTLTESPPTLRGIAMIK
ncbi:hypothetical protein NPIL_632591, partial [Nephila pilipes]